MNTAEIILSQLGGQRFIAMTGAHNFVSDGNTLRMTLRRNRSSANRLYITLDEGTDTYNMEFIRVTGGTIDPKTFSMRPVQTKKVKVLEDVYCDQLCQIFEAVTGFCTRL